MDSYERCVLRQAGELILKREPMGLSELGVLKAIAGLLEDHGPGLSVGLRELEARWNAYFVGARDPAVAGDARWGMRLWG